MKYDKSVVSVAADWSVYPVGTVLKIKGDNRIYLVEDYGSALVGTETVDIYKPSMSAMNDWGVRHVEMKVVKRGCEEKSVEILKSRSQYRHCREMLENLI